MFNCFDALCETTRWGDQRINAEKVEFTKERAIKVCAKARIGGKMGYKKRVFVQIFKKVALKVESLDGPR